MKKSTEYERLQVLVGKLDLHQKNKERFCTEAAQLRLKILRSAHLGFNQKSELTSDISYKAAMYEYKL